MNPIKRFFKINSHSPVLKPLAGLGRSINRLYENRNHDASSNGELNLLKKFSSLNPSVIFDVGANVGEYAMLASSHCAEATIYSFEPVSKTYTMLQANIKDHAREKIIPVNKGFYSENKKQLINIYPGHEHASLHDIKGLSYSIQAQEEIELITGDSFIHDKELNKIDLIKMDVEGAEMDALIGLKAAFAKKIVRLVQFEYGYINVTTKNLLVDYYEFFRRYDYVVGKIYPKYVDFREYSFYHEDFIGPNFIAVNKSDEQLINILSK